MRSLLKVLAIAGLVLIGVLAERADSGTTGGISGHILYADGKPASGFAIWACSATEIAVAITKSDGFYSFVSLAPGMYSLHIVSKTAYASSEDGIRVTADDVATQDVTHVCPLTKICGDFFAHSRPLRAGTSADVGNFDADDIDRTKSCGSAW